MCTQSATSSNLSTPPSTPPTSSSSSKNQELLLDAQDMGQALQVLTRPGAREKLESYVHTLEHEAAVTMQRQEEEDGPRMSFLEEWQKCCDYVTEGAWY